MRNKILALCLLLLCLVTAGCGQKNAPVVIDGVK